MKIFLKYVATGLCFVFLCCFCFAPLGIAALAGGDGSSYEEAIVVPFTGDYLESVGQEYHYMDQVFGPEGGEWQIISQRLEHQNNKDYDVFEILWIQSGKEQTIYFDVTELIKNSPFKKQDS